MNKCYVCGNETVIWKSDFDYEDYGYEGNGIVHNYTCMNCGADIEVREPINADREVQHDEKKDRKFGEKHI